MTTKIVIMINNEFVNSNNKKMSTITIKITGQECQLLLKAKYWPRAMPVQHFMNPGQLVQESCTETNTKNHVTLTLDM